MALNYSSKHDISYASYNNKTIPWKVNTSIISQNNQNTNPSLNLGTINNNLVIESSQNDILFITSQNDNDNDNKKVIVKNNMDVDANLDVSNNLTTKLNVSYDISLNNILYFPSLPVNIIGDLKVRGAISVLGKTTPGLVKSESQFVNVTLSGSRFTDVSIVSSTISVSDFSNVNIINSYINDIPNGFGYDKSNNALPNKAIFSDVSLQRLILDSSINSSYINFANNTSNAISIRSSADYSKLVISKPLNVGTETISNISNVSIFYGDISCNNLYYSRLVPDVKLNNYSDVSIGEVSISGNNVPASNIRINIGSNAYKFNNTYSTYFNGDLSGQATLANNLIKNLDMSFNNLDICGTITLNKLNLNQFLSSDLISIVDGNSSFITISNKVRDLSAIVYTKSDFDLCLNTYITKISLLETSFVALNGNLTSISNSVYSKSDFDLCLNTHITKISLLETSFVALNGNITSISNSVYSKSDFDLCLNRNILRISDVSAIASVVSSPPNIYPTLGYNDNLSIKQTNAKVVNELVFPYAITYIDDVTEDTNIKEAYSYSATTTKYTITTTTNYISTRTTGYDTVPVANRQPNDVNLTRAVMVYARGDSALTPSRSRTWSNVSASNTLPAVYVNVRVATPRSVTYQINTSLLTWEQHRLNAQQVPGRYLATILSSSEQTDATLVKNAAGTGNVWIGGRRRTSPEFVVTNTGGTITSNSTYVVHTFTTSSTLTISSSISVEYLVVAGGGAGGVGRGGGGGAGGVLRGTISLSPGTHNITVGAGGASVTANNIRNSGGSSSISNLVVAIGGGGGGSWEIFMGDVGGSGGGSSAREGDGGRNGTPGQGFDGSPRLGVNNGGGGGGAGAQAGVPLPTRATGAIGISSEITGILKYYAGGGGGGAVSGITPGLASGGIYQTQNGTYGGGNGANTTNGTKPEYTDAVPNTGGGGGGNEGAPSGAGGSGIVIIRYLKSATNQANVKTDAAWEWHNGDEWNYQNFIGGQPDNLTATRLRIWGETWDDFTSDSVLPALYMTLQLQSYTNYTYEGNTTLLTWDNHKLKAQEVINRYLATIENNDQNTWVADCINDMAIDNTFKDGIGVYIGALRTSNSTASGFSASDWQWSNGTTWSYSNFYRQGATQQDITYSYSSYIPQQPTSDRSTPVVNSPITIDATNTKIPNLISSVNGNIAVTSTAIGAINLPASTTTGPIIPVGYPNTTGVTTLANNNKQYTTTIRTYTTTVTYAYNGTLLVTSATATGGNSITLSTNNLYRIHIFTSDDVFTPAFNGTVEVLLVGGGGGGGQSLGGGGGGGGVVYMPVVDVSAGQNYNIVVGSGGSGGTGVYSGTDGNASMAFTAIAAGGGSSGSYSTGGGRSGGSGGGAAANDFNGSLNLGGASSGNSLGTNSGFIYGSRGGNMTTTRNSTPTRAAGGGGAGGQGSDTNPNIIGTDTDSNVTGDTGQTGAGSGGVGIINNILGTTHYWGGGGGGGAYHNQCGGYGGFGGGGGGAGNGGTGITGGGMGGINALNNGSNGSGGYAASGGAGGANTGGGGGGGSYYNGVGGRGGDGIVIIRYLIEQPIGSFKISENTNNTSNYITRSSNTNIPTSYSCIAVTNDGMFVALGKASDVTVYIRNSGGWATLGSPISVNFSAYTETSVGIIPTQFTDNWRKNLQNLAINFNYFSGSTTSQLILAFGDTRNIIKVYSYSGGSWSFSNALYSVAGGTWGSTFLRAHNATTAEINNNNFGYFVTLSQSPSILGFTVANNFYTYNCTTSIGSQRGTVQTLVSSHNSYTNIIAFKMSSDAGKIIVSNSYYVFIYKWNINDWTRLTTISYVSAAITFTYPNTSTTPIPAGPRSLDISNISSDECVFAIGFPDKLIDTSANRKARGYVEYWKLTDSSLNRLATLVPRKRNIDNSNVDTDEYFFSAGGIKITNANTILVAPNFKFHLSSTNKIYTLSQNSLDWATHNNNSNAKAIVGREMASIENEADNELVKVSARNNNVWIGATRISNISTGITSSDWAWSDPSSIWNYTSFNSGEPNRFAETRIQSLSGTWYDTDQFITMKAVYMTRLQYSLNTFTIFNNFFLHSSGFSSSYANTDIASAVIAKWVRTDSPLTQHIEFRGNGNLLSKSQGIFTTSDIRLKENIVDASPKLVDLLKVRVVNYNLKGSDGTKLIGVVAQELETLFPTLVNNGELSPHDTYLGKTESYKSVKYSCFDVILIKAFQEQMAIINKLSAQLDDLECKTKSLKTISQEHAILKQDLEFLKRENELFKLNINEITMLMAKC
jgi:hypothetical protein